MLVLALVFQLRRATMALLLVKLFTGFTVSASVAILTCDLFGLSSLLDENSPVSCPAAFPDDTVVNLAYAGIIVQLGSLPIIIGLHRFLKRDPALDSDFKPAFWYMEFVLLLESTLIYFAPLSGKTPNLGISVVLVILSVLLFGFILKFSPWVVALNWMRSVWLLMQVVVFFGALSFALQQPGLSWACAIASIITYIQLASSFTYGGYAYVKRPLPSYAALDNRRTTRASDGLGMRVIITGPPPRPSRISHSWLRSSSRSLFGTGSTENNFFPTEEQWYLTDKIIDNLVMLYGNGEPFISDENEKGEGRKEAEGVTEVEGVADEEDAKKEGINPLPSPSITSPTTSAAAETPRGTLDHYRRPSVAATLNPARRSVAPATTAAPAVPSVAPTPTTAKLPAPGAPVENPLRSVVPIRRPLSDDDLLEASMELPPVLTAARAALAPRRE
jgi:hypothetical protein